MFAGEPDGSRTLARRNPPDRGERLAGGAWQQRRRRAGLPDGRAGWCGTERRWRVAATLYFTTGDSRYSWLDGALALWEGEFNEVTGHARYTALLQPATPAA